MWLEQATALKKTLGLWTAIQERDANGLRMMIRGPQPDMLDWGPLYGDFLSPIRGQQGRAPKDPLTLAKVYLARAINQRLHPFSSATFVCLDSNGNLKRHSRPVNLRTALWMQLSEIVTGTRKIRFCEICGELMDVTNNTRGKKVHDRCSQRERMQRYRKTRNGEKTRK